VSQVTNDSPLLQISNSENEFATWEVRRCLHQQEAASCSRGTMLVRAISSIKDIS
jgi:hypothetical protein